MRNSFFSFSFSFGFLQVPSTLQQSFFSWKKNRENKVTTLPSCVEGPSDVLRTVNSVSFPPSLCATGNLRAKRNSSEFQVIKDSKRRIHRLHSLSVMSRRHWKEQKPSSCSCSWLHIAPETELGNILSLHTPGCYLEQYKETKCGEPVAIPL